MELGDDDIKRMNWFGLKHRVAAILGSRPINPLAQFVARAILPPGVAQRIPLTRVRVTYRLADRSAVYLMDTRRDIIARDIYFGSEQPTSKAERLKLRCVEILGKHAKCFLDIGAYSGICALIAARSNPSLRSIAYEIVPENFLLLVHNILENDLAQSVEPKLRGIGATTSTIRLPMSMNLPSNATSISLGSQFQAGIEIGVRDLDSETGHLDGPFFVKIDVEGYEQQVFEGGAKFFSEQKPDIICEVLPSAHEACNEISRILKPLGYRWFVFLEEGLVEREIIRPDALCRDWLLSARSDIDFILSPLRC